MSAIEWRQIRTYKGSQNAGFEELVCQLAFAYPEIRNKKEFIRVEAPDGGVEAFWTLENGNEIGWQAKFFIEKFGTPQWNDIKESFETALEKHPQLTEYYICLPVDFSDPRIPKKKSLRDKWNDNISTWTKYASDKGRDIKFHLWGSFELKNQISKPANDGKRYYWFDSIEFSEKWFIDQANEAIENLGERYTPKINVELNISKSFDGIFRSKKYSKEITSLFDTFLVEYNECFRDLNDDVFFEQKNIAKGSIKNLKILFEQVKYDQIIEINISEWIDKLLIVDSCIDFITKKLDHLDEADKAERLEKGTLKADDSYSRFYIHLYGHEKSKLRDLNKATRELINFMDGSSTEGFNKPFILLKGEKGMGKSHLLADIIRNNLKDQLFSILLLGQHFTLEDPWVQILQNLGINCNKDEFLGALNTIGESRQSRIVIVVDAINEGSGIELWPKYIRGFIQKIKVYPWIGLIFSVRSPYESLIFDEKYLEDNFIEIEHLGFNENEYDASKIFFKEYGIEQPKIPLLYSEFRNPLFLKLFCDGLKKANRTAIPKEGYEGISEIMNYLIRAVNIELSKKNRLDFAPSLNLVGEALNIFIECLLQSKKHSLLYTDCHILLENGLAKFKIKSGILEELIRENLLSKTLFWKNEKYEEGVYFPYQRYEDHLKAKYLLEKYCDPDNPKLAFRKNSEIGSLFNDKHTAHRNVNILEAFAIQIPEYCGLELYQAFPHIKSYNYFVHAVIDSLHWRKNETLDKKLIHYLKSYFDENNFHRFLNVILLISGKPHHYFNSDFIHKWLIKMPMADRDKVWTIYINENYKRTSAVRRLIDWAWNNESKSHVSSDSLLHVSTTLTWFLTASNRNLRDATTKALVATLKNRVSICLALLKKFKLVNDIGVYERLFAVSYAVILVSDSKEEIQELGIYVYNEIFLQEKVIPHILLRDYARNIIEFCVCQENTFKIDKNKITPPYTSDWYKKIITPAKIKNLEFDYKSSSFKDHYWAQNSIISSVNGRSGDFDKYELSRITRKWDIKMDELKRLVIQRTFELGYDVDKHGEYDRSISNSHFSDHKVERIGKKYQWQALYEVAAKISDKKKTLKDEGKFDGTWEPYIRDIDPTVNIKTTKAENYKELTKHWWFDTSYENWLINDEQWIHSSKDLPSIDSLLQRKNKDGKDWLLLNLSPRWESPTPLGSSRYGSEKKDVVFWIEAYIIKSEKLEIFKKHFCGIGKKEIENAHRSTVYEIFYREYYWSPAFRNMFEGYENYRTFSAKKDLKKRITENFLFASYEFLWEEQMDYSKDGHIRVNVPSKVLFDGLHMDFGATEGEFVNSKGELVCFDPCVTNESTPCILVRQDALQEFLSKEKLALVWMVNGEKRLLGDYGGNRSKYWGRNNLSGFYYLEEGEIKGRLNSNIEDHKNQI